METKTCLDCGLHKPLTEFSNDRSRKDGVKPYCKKCFSIRVENYHNSWGAGIYKIVNNITQELYVGQSTQLRRRKCEHFTKGRQAHTKSPLLADSMNTYGKQNFEFVKLTNCPINELETLEAQYIKELKPTLNSDTF